MLLTHAMEPASDGCGHSSDPNKPWLTSDTQVDSWTKAASLHNVDRDVNGHVVPSSAASTRRSMNEARTPEPRTVVQPPTWY